MSPLRTRLVVLLGAVPIALAPPTNTEKPDVRAKIEAPASLAAGSRAAISVELTLGSGWHVNSHTPSESFLIPTDVALTTSQGTLSPVRYPKDVKKQFAFSEQPLRIYEGTVRFVADLDLPADAGSPAAIRGTLTYQACNDRQCFPPAKISLEASVTVSGPAKAASSTPQPQ